MAALCGQPAAWAFRKDEGHVEMRPRMRCDLFVWFVTNWQAGGVAFVQDCFHGWNARDFSRMTFLVMVLLLFFGLCLISLLLSGDLTG